MEVKNTHDAMIDATAIIAADILVPNDQRLFKRIMAIADKTKVLQSEKFRALLEAPQICSSRD
jgi:exonuclease I